MVFLVVQIHVSIYLPRKELSVNEHVLVARSVLSSNWMGLHIFIYFIFLYIPNGEKSETVELIRVVLSGECLCNLWNVNK